MDRPDAGRAIAPAVGIVLLVAIVATLGALAAVAVMDISEEREPQPNVALDVELADDGTTHVLVHGGGDTLDGDKVTIQGAAEPSVLGGTELTAEDEAQFFPVEENVSLVYTGEHGTTYLLASFDAMATVPEPDQHCEWVQDETDGGTSSITVDQVVNCDIVTDGSIDIGGDGVVIGEAVSNAESVDIDGGEVYEDVTAADDVDMDTGDVGGDVTAGNTVNIDEGIVDGSVDAGTDVDLGDDGPVTVGGDVTADNSVDVEEGIVDGSVDAGTDVDLGDDGPVTVGGDVTADNSVDVEEGTVEGAIAAAGAVDIDETTVSGDVYVGGSFDCSDSEVDGTDCGAYTPNDYADW